MTNLTNLIKTNMNTNTTTIVTNEETTMTTSNMTMAQLIARYNELAAKPRKSFKNKLEAIKHIETLEMTQEEAPVAAPTQQPAPSILDFGTTEAQEAANVVMVEKLAHEDIMTHGDINVQAIVSIITSGVFQETLDTQKAVVIASAIVDAVTKVYSTRKPEMFKNYILSNMTTCELSSVVPAKKGEKRQEATILKNGGELAFTTERSSKFGLWSVLQSLGYVTEEGLIGNKLIEIYSQRQEAYAPVEVGTAWERRFPIAPEKSNTVHSSGLLEEAVEALQRTEYTVDEYMLSIANQVQAHYDTKNVKDDEAYVLSGCNKMSADKAYTSEFKADRRLRLYQAACHGPNGQASDRSRALMDLAGVTQDYDVAKVASVIKAEMLDMINISNDRIVEMMEYAVANPVKFIVSQINKAKKDRSASKPWSFVKAARILLELSKGNKPYIGMAVGLDAKCSGPQYGALMAGDVRVAAACGVINGKSDKDAYELAIQELEEAGLAGFSRGGIKKAYMGIFYGQGQAAFNDIEELISHEQFEILDILHQKNDDGSYSIIKGRSQLFHDCITDSFGPVMKALRQRFAKYQECEFRDGERAGHIMPDGCMVQMNYKVKQNILGETVDFDTTNPDVFVATETGTYKFIKLALNTRTPHHSDFVRNGFVNMIQATDALIARLIIVHLRRLGAQHIISVHDCFRVNVTEVHLLEQAIINAYQDLFGTETNVKTKDMPFGLDILALYFKGLNNRITRDSKPVVAMPQFDAMYGDIRKIQEIKGSTLANIFDNLGKQGGSYYFAK